MISKQHTRNYSTIASANPQRDKYLQELSNNYKVKQFSNKAENTNNKNIIVNRAESAHNI